jgi:hypothetical protein
MRERKISMAVFREKIIISVYYEIFSLNLKTLPFETPIEFLILF